MKNRYVLNNVANIIIKFGANKVINIDETRINAFSLFLRAIVCKDQETAMLIDLL